MELAFTRLPTVAVRDLVALHGDPRVRRHLPLSSGTFDDAACRRWIAAKEALWARHGYGPWAFLVDGKLAGWGGLQPEHGEPDLALVLAPDYWGWGPAIAREILRRAFGEMGFQSVTALLPPSRVRQRALCRLGFRRDGLLDVGGVVFVRYRLSARAFRSMLAPGR